jgi:hypothetical protein
MTTELTTGLLPVGIKADGGITFEVAYGPENTDVEITVEYPDYSGWTGERVGEKYITLSREDWEAVVAHVAAELSAKQGRA